MHYACWSNAQLSHPSKASSSIIKDHQSLSSVIKRHQASSSVIKHHQASSSVIKHLQALSSVIMHYYLSAMSSKMPSDCNCSELAVSWLCFGSVSSLKRSCKSIKPDIRSMVLLYVSSIANSLLQNGQWHAGSCQYQTVVKYQRNFRVKVEK